MEDKSSSKMRNKRKKTKQHGERRAFQYFRISEKRDIQMNPWKWIQEHLINSKRMFLSHCSWLDWIEFQNYGIPGFHKNQWLRKLCRTIIACNPLISQNQPNDQRVLIAHPSLSDGFHFLRSKLQFEFLWLILFPLVNCSYHMCCHAMACVPKVLFT